jgi:two-component system sensor histidine kinase AlgZ
VTHGISRLSEGGLLSIRARRRGDGLRIVVENPYDPEVPPRRGSGLGLTNVRRRLAARYGDEASMEVETGDRRYRVVLDLPVGAEAEA